MTSIMKNAVLKYLQSYPRDPFQVDRLIVSAFLYSFELETVQNSFISPYIISSNDNEYADLQNFLDIYKFSNFEELIQIFEFVLSPEERIITGAIYTPKNIREYITNQCFEQLHNLSNVKICDPACGCGGFLFTAAKIIHERTGKPYEAIFAENIFGLDIQGYAINRSMLMLTLLAIVEGETTNFQFNLNQGNALSYSWREQYQNFAGFDVIVGNPPYVCSRNIDDESKELILDWKVSQSGHPDLYIPFFQVGIENLCSKGVLGFITMNTFFKSVNGRALRQYFEDENINLKILDFGGNQIFQSKSTYTCICIIQKLKSSGVDYAIGNIKTLLGEITYQHIPYFHLNHKAGWNLQYHDLVKKITQSGKPFGDLYRTRNGIATLKNDVYIFDEIHEDEHFYYLQNGAIYPIEKEICRDIVNPNKLTQAKSIGQIKQRIIFPYEFTNSGRAVLITQDDFQSKYPQAFNYLKSKREILATRDKSKGNYKEWYAYGRNQSLEKYSKKMFFPHITPHIPNYIISNDVNLLFYNGIAVVSDDDQELQFLKKLMSSKLFWFYIVHSSKPYGSGYFSLSRNYIKSFGVYNFNNNERDYIINETNMEKLNFFIESRYDIEVPG